ncbi:TIGR02530 family flagellar biosynthesis protein [Clostridium neuense]|uniref:TIGR02530 family flagellar biosynthesis protein n=1 Tax=Clostridium neuense TaxID=1728934 RepID=A0ABW8TGH5_9CLOT
MRYRVINGELFPVESISSGSNKHIKYNSAKTNTTFEKILDDNLNTCTGFNISKHAAERIKSRNIELNEADMKKINQGINDADEKGAKDCLILYKDVALIASIKSRTIITAIDKDSRKENVFTNIDSVVLL